MGPKLQSKKTERKIVHIQTDRQKDILTYRQTHLHTDRQTDRHTKHACLEMQQAE